MNDDPDRLEEFGLWHQEQAIEYFTEELGWACVIKHPDGTTIPQDEVLPENSRGRPPNGIYLIDIFIYIRVKIEFRSFFHVDLFREWFFYERVSRTYNGGRVEMFIAEAGGWFIHFVE